MKRGTAQSERMCYNKETLSIRNGITYIIVIAMIAGSGLFLFGALGDPQVEICNCECSSKAYPDCNLNNTNKDYIRECWMKAPPCPLDATDSKDNSL